MRRIGVTSDRPGLELAVDRPAGAAMPELRDVPIGPAVALLVAGAIAGATIAWTGAWTGTSFSAIETRPADHAAGACIALDLAEAHGFLDAAERRVVTRALATTHHPHGHRLPQRRDEIRAHCERLRGPSR